MEQHAFTIPDHNKKTGNCTVRTRILCACVFIDACCVATFMLDLAIQPYALNVFATIAVYPTAICYPFADSPSHINCISYHSPSEEE